MPVGITRKSPNTMMHICLFSYSTFYLGIMITDLKIKSALKQLFAEFVALVPISDILIELRSRSLMDDNVIAQIKKMPTREDMSKKFIQVLIHHCNHFTFYILCSIIRNHPEQAVQAFGLKLDLLARDLLRDVMEVPIHRYIYVIDSVDAIASNLKMIHGKSGKIIVRGTAGCGKTIALSQAIRKVVQEEGCFNPDGIYWVDIGDINEDRLLQKLLSLYHRLNAGIAITQSPTDLIEVVDCIQYYLHDNIKGACPLFIFDDVRNLSFMDYFTFADKAVVTTHNLDGPIDDSFHQIMVQAAWKFDDIAQFLRLLDKNKSKTTITEQVTGDLIDVSCVLPLNVTLISSSYLDDINRSFKALKMIEYNRLVINKKRNLMSNVQTVIMMTVDCLDSNFKQRLFDLSIFKCVRIPVTMIMLLWRKSFCNTLAILKELEGRYLLTVHKNYQERYFCQINAAVVDFLRMQYNECERGPDICDHKINLHAKLIDSCYWKYGSLWNQHKDDGYFYHYIIEHIIDAKATDTLVRLIDDIEWTETKLRATRAVSSIYLDMKCCETYFQAKRIKYGNAELFHILKQFGQYLNMQNIDLVQFILFFGDETTQIFNKALAIAKARTVEKLSIYSKLRCWYAISEEQNKITAKSFTKRVKSSSPVYACSNPSLSELKFVLCENDGMKSKVTTLIYDKGNSVTNWIKMNVKIKSIKISADGSIIALKYHEPPRLSGLDALYYNTFARNDKGCEDDVNLSNSNMYHKWEIWLADNHERLQFVQYSNADIVDCADCQLEFSPKIAHIAFTIDVRSRKSIIKIWQIYETSAYCKERIVVESNLVSWQQFAVSKSMLLFWTKQNLEENVKYHAATWNKCQIDVWNIEDVYRIWRIRLPRLILKYDYSTTKESVRENKTLLLQNLSYDGLKNALLVQYGCILGYVLLEQNENNTIDVRKEFKNLFRACYKLEYGYKHLSTSYDCQLLLFQSANSEDLLIIKWNYDGIIPSRLIHFQWPIYHVRFIPGMQDLLIYRPHSQDINIIRSDMNIIRSEHYCYNVEKNRNWKSLAIDYNFINQTPILAIILLLDQILTLNIYKGETLEQVSSNRVGGWTNSKPLQEWNICLFQNLHDFIILEKYECNGGCSNSRTSHSMHSHVITQLREVNNPRRVKWETEQTFVAYNLQLWKMNYRKFDHKFIFTWKYDEEQFHYSYGLIISMINYLDGQIVKVFQEYDPLCKRKVLIFEDDHHMLVHSWTHQFGHILKVYRLDNNSIIQQTRKQPSTSHINISKISIPTDGSSINISRPMDLKLASAELGVSNYKILEGAINSINGDYFFVQYGTNYVIYNSNWYIISIGYQGVWMHCNMKLLNVVQCWQGKYILELEDNLIRIYHRKTLQPVQQLCFQLMKRIKKLKLSDDQNLMICNDSRKNYYVLRKIDI
ncbi:Apoptotic protease-activating factor 1 [Trichoplax sp. H2]|nr:Apoptotic protease-activating factor 1 [Trichoplax sp. H2]|eukprot:RDD38113.1 Apoptotic protease-activating factor 1 [Trichoplax sp. H2]